MVRAFSSFSCWGPKQTPSASKVVDVICVGAGSDRGGGTWEPTIIATADSCGSIWATAIQPLLLWPANGSSLVQPGQIDSGQAKHLIVPTQQIASQQTLVKVT